MPPTIWIHGFSTVQTTKMIKHARRAYRNLCEHTIPLYLFIRNYTSIIIIWSLLGLICSRSIIQRSAQAFQPQSLRTTPPPRNSIPCFYILEEINVQRLPLAILWISLAALDFSIANQRLPSSIEEDRINKPYRPIASGRITPASASTLRMCICVTALAFSMTLGNTRFSSSDGHNLLLQRSWWIAGPIDYTGYWKCTRTSKLAVWVYHCRWRRWASILSIWHSLRCCLIPLYGYDGCYSRFSWFWGRLDVWPTHTSYSDWRESSTIHDRHFFDCLFPGDYYLLQQQLAIGLCSKHVRGRASIETCSYDQSEGG